MACVDTEEASWRQMRSYVSRTHCGLDLRVVPPTHLTHCCPANWPLGCHFLITAFAGYKVNSSQEAENGPPKMSTAFSSEPVTMLLYMANGLYRGG